MPDIPDFDLDPRKKPPSKPYRGHPVLTVKMYAGLTHAQQMAVDRKMDAAAGLKRASMKGAGEGQFYVVSHRADQTGER